ncbi:glycine zipper domain-containing protein [Comamonas jiangduensis]|uniref:glycine zipper domain-containing protein n=1 Tax=Comamonas jiangduensis TaxID=1194168 RepID=UPI003BF81FEA
MKYILSLKRTVTACAVASLLAGCATTDGSNNTVIGGVIGAVAGAAIASATGGNPLAGAAAGAAVGIAAGYLYEVHTKQQRTAQQSNNIYRNANGGRLPQRPTVVTYQPKLNAPYVRPGQPFALNSVVEVVDGQQQRVNNVREELQIIMPNGEPLQRPPASKDFVATGAGRYENQFKLSLPSGISQGSYKMRTALYVNNEKVAERDLQTQVVIIDNVPQIIQVAAL